MNKNKTMEEDETQSRMNKKLPKEHKKNEKMKNEKEKEKTEELERREKIKETGRRSREGVKRK